MALGSVLLIVALLIAVVLFVARPFIEENPTGIPEDTQRSVWLAERERIYEALLELDFDKQLGKIPEEIYTPRRETLLQQGARILKKLDETDLDLESGAGDKLEALITAHKAERG